METTGGMIADLIARGERIRDNALLKGDHGRSKCQEFQQIRVFDTDKPQRHIEKPIVNLSQTLSQTCRKDQYNTAIRYSR